MNDPVILEPATVESFIILPVTLRILPLKFKLASPFTVVALTEVITLLLPALVYDVIAADDNPVRLDPSPANDPVNDPVSLVSATVESFVIFLSDKRFVEGLYDKSPPPSTFNISPPETVL